MEIKIHNYRGMAKELKRIADTLDDFTAHYKARMFQEGFHPPVKPDTDTKLEVSYVDPEEEFVDEVKELMGKLPKDEEEE